MRKAVLLAVLLACSLAARAHDEPGDPPLDTPSSPGDPDGPLVTLPGPGDSPDGDTTTTTDPTDPPLDQEDPPVLDDTPPGDGDGTEVIPIMLPIHVRPAKGQCSQPKVTGPCRAYQRRWWYNGKAGKCERFVYGGCQGNQNNFAFKAGCERVCGKPPRRPNACAQPKKVGPCRARLPRFFFDKATNTCKRFWYGGCSGNSNRFLAKRACEKACVKRSV